MEHGSFIFIVTVSLFMMVVKETASALLSQSKLKK